MFKFHFFCSPDLFIEELEFSAICAIDLDHRPNLIKNMKEAKSAFVMQKKEWLIWDMLIRIIMKGETVLTKKGNQLFLTNSFEALGIAELINRNFSDIEKLNNEMLSDFCSQYSKGLSAFLVMVNEEGH